MGTEWTIDIRFSINKMESWEIMLVFYLTIRVYLLALVMY